MEDEAEAPVIVDCDLLEKSKENVQPLAKGRRVTALSAVLSTPHALRDSKLGQERARWRARVRGALERCNRDSGREGEENCEAGKEEDEEESPLDAYQGFVTWTLEQYPQGHSAESGLLELLEEATRLLKDFGGGKYKDDLKYLKLWILYATFVEKPIIIYRFLLANDIGTGWAAFYEEFAITLERESRHKESDAIYQLGIARQASPLDRLRNRHRDFQKRMMSSTTLPPSSPSEATPAPVPAPATIGKRTVLGTSKLISGAPLPVEVSVPSRPNAGIPVFQDTPVPDAPAEIQTNAYPDVGTRKTRVKENTREVGKMGGTVMKAARKTAVPTSGSTIQIYRDPEPEEKEEERGSVKPSTSKGKLQVHRDEPPKPIHGRTSSKDGAAKIKSTRGTAASTVNVFRDEEPKPAPATKGKIKAKAPSASGSSIAVFRDEPGITAFSNEEAKVTLATNGKTGTKTVGRAGSAIAVFRDEPDRTKPMASRTGSTVTPLRDEGATPSATKGKSKAKAPSGSAIAVFRDDHDQAETPLAAEIATSAPRAAFTPFKDELAASGNSGGGFVPFRDEPDEAKTIIVGKDKEKGKGIMYPVLGSAEAEALRKDPLKNYSNGCQFNEDEGLPELAL